MDRSVRRQPGLGDPVLDRAEDHGDGGQDVKVIEYEYRGVVLRWYEKPPEFSSVPELYAVVGRNDGGIQISSTQAEAVRKFVEAVKR